MVEVSILSHVLPQFSLRRCFWCPLLPTHLLCTLSWLVVVTYIGKYSTVLFVRMMCTTRVPSSLGSWSLPCPPSLVPVALSFPLWGGPFFFLTLGLKLVPIIGFFTLSEQNQLTSQEMRKESQGWIRIVSLTRWDSHVLDTKESHTPLQICCDV